MFRAPEAFVESTMATAVSRLERIDRLIRTSESMGAEELRMLRKQVLMARDNIRAAMMLAYPVPPTSSIGRST